MSHEVHLDDEDAHLVVVKMRERNLPRRKSLITVVNLEWYAVSIMTCACMCTRRERYTAINIMPAPECAEIHYHSIANFNKHISNKTIMK